MTEENQTSQEQAERFLCLPKSNYDMKAMGVQPTLPLVLYYQWSKQLEAVALGHKQVRLGMNELYLNTLTFQNDVTGLFNQLTIQEVIRDLVQAGLDMDIVSRAAGLCAEVMDPLAKHLNLLNSETKTCTSDYFYFSIARDRYVEAWKQFRQSGAEAPHPKYIEEVDTWFFTQRETISKGQQRLLRMQRIHQTVVFDPKFIDLRCQQLYRLLTAP